MDIEEPDLSMVAVGVYQVNTSDGELTSLYQLEYDDIPLEWNVTDEDSDVANVTWSVGSLPYSSDIHPETNILDSQIPLRSITMQPGETIFFTVQATDFAGNQATLVSPSLTVDTSPPVIERFSCSRYISLAQSELNCTWSTALDGESPISELAIGLGSEQLQDDMVTFTKLYFVDQQWTVILSPDVILSANSTGYVSLKVTNMVKMESVALAEVIIGKVLLLSKYSNRNGQQQVMQSKQSQN